MPSPILLAAFLLLAASATSPGPHIADLNVLLPPLASHPVSFRLQGSDGCFAWSWDHHEILSVQPEYNDSSWCSTSARLVSIAPYSGRKETAVYAADRCSGITIRCKVFVDRISRIQIFHHAVKIDLDELATLQVRAFDDEDNIFSSLVGLKFLWQLEPKSSKSVKHHLVHVPLKETPLSDCGGFCGDLDTQIDIEHKGFGSDLYVVKGTEIGHEVVTAQLLEPELEHVVDKILLTVAEAMSLDPPSPVFITIGALIYYNLRVIRLNAPQVINLPSPYHRWSVVNSTVAQVDSEMGIAHALNLGITNIVVEDIRLSDNLQTSSMHVVVPDKLALYIFLVSRDFDSLEEIKYFPSSVIWYVFPGQEYIIHMKVFSEGPDVNEIHITDNNDLTLESSTTKHWDISPVTHDISVTYDKRKARLLRPISEGQGVLTASLNYLSGNKESVEVLTVVQKITVCSKVKFSFGEEYGPAQIIRLPWAAGVYQEVELKATGGCGRTSEDYIWFTSDEAIVSVSASGLLQTKNPGRSIVKVVSVFDSINYDEVVVEVSLPSSMTMLQNFPVEAVIGTQLEAAVTMNTLDGNYYFKCDAFDSFVRWKVFSENETFKVLNTTMKENLRAMLSHLDGLRVLHVPPCAQTHLYASAVGRATLHATFEDGLIILKAISSLAAYSPLVVHQAGDGNQFGGYSVDLTRKYLDIFDGDHIHFGDLYLVPGSSMDLLLVGGPGRWDQKIQYTEAAKVSTEQDELVTGGVLVKSCGGRLYSITCQNLGKFKLLFSRGNLVGEDHPVPAIAYTELHVICSFPSSITVIANERENTPGIIGAAIKADRSPGRIRVAPVTVANGCTIRLSAVGIHTSGRAFANSSSLSLRWELNDCEELARWSNSFSFENSAWERFLVLQNASGLCIVRATVTGLTKPVASHIYEGKHLLGNTENILTDAIRLQLVSTLKVIPESVLLVFDPEAKVILSVTGGTCFLDAVVNDTQVAHLSQPLEGVECSRLELNARGLGAALVTVWDIGLSPPAAASALVKVANVDWIKIMSDEEISLLEGAFKAFDILAGVQDGCIFDYSQYTYMNIQVHIDEGILELVIMNDSSPLGEWMISEPHFSVKAVVSGITTLYVSVRQRYGHEVLSQMIKVEVYKPLSLHPDYIYLAPGASYVLMVKGGPKRGALVEYASIQEETAIIQVSSGRISAISVGNATVRATVFGSGGTLICEAYGRVEVGIPSAMFINMQSDQLCIGCEMPVYPSFPKGNLFSFYEVCSDYKWAIENEKVLSFQTPSSLVSDVGITSVGKYHLFNSHDRENAFISVLFGGSAGRTKVSVSFSCEFVLSDVPQQVSYNASGMLTVVPDPPLALGIPITWIFPPFYTSLDRLPGATDSEPHLYSPNRRSTSYSVLKTCGKKDISKQDAITIDGNKIRTRESNELACIEAKDRTTGRREIASCVRVAEVAQVRVSTKESVFHTAYLASNAKLELAISYCDDLGYPFSEANGVVSLDFETNYPDVVSIQMTNDENIVDGVNGNVYLEAKSPGNALIMVSLKHKREKAGFILVSVGAQLYPQNAVIHAGHRLNFTITGDDGFASGQWFSSNESVLSVNALSGEAYAHGEGSVQVVFKGSNLKLQTTVRVLEIDQIVVGSPEETETLTNVPFPTEGYKFPVKFSDHFDSKLEAAGKDVQFLFDCKVDPPFVGYTKSWSDHGTGNSYCLFFPYPPKHLQSSMSDSKAMRTEQHIKTEGLMYISIVATLREAPQIVGVAHALFVGGFFVEDVGKLNFTPSLNKSLIRVIGNTEIEVYWNSKDLLQVTPFKTKGSGIGGVREYKVEVLKDQEFTDMLTFALPATGQQIEISVNYEPHGERSIVPEVAIISNSKWIAVATCVVILLATFLIFMKLLDRSQRRPRSSTQVVRMGTPIMSSPIATPERSPPSTTAISGIEASPQTPSQPFVEYLRRTIDDTPYYKRNGRRRFDPQKTY